MTSTRLVVLLEPDSPDPTSLRVIHKVKAIVDSPLSGDETGAQQVAENKAHIAPPRDSPQPLSSPRSLLDLRRRITCIALALDPPLYWSLANSSSLEWMGRWASLSKIRGRETETASATKVHAGSTITVRGRMAICAQQPSRCCRNPTAARLLRGGGRAGRVVCQQLAGVNSHGLLNPRRVSQYSYTYPQHRLGR